MNRRPTIHLLLAVAALVALGSACSDDEPTATSATEGATGSGSDDTTGTDAETTPAGVDADDAPCSATGSVTGDVELDFADVPSLRLLGGEAGLAVTTYTFQIEGFTGLLTGGDVPSFLLSSDEVSFGSDATVDDEGSGGSVDADLEAIGGGSAAHATVTITCD